MLLRNAAVRHGRTLASPLSRSALRQLSTETPDVTDTPTTSTPSEKTAQWATSQAAKQVAEPPKKIKSSRRKQSKYIQDNILNLGVDSGASHQGRSWTQTHQIGNAELTPAEQWAEFQRIQRQTKTLGSQLDRRYSASDLVSNPPAAEDLTLELLMASQTHMGHHTSQWNPANSRYIYGVREGIHIISLETTAAHLRRAARVVEEVAYRGGTILFVGTRRGQMEVVTKASEMAGACHVFTKWAPGSITNRDVMLRGHVTKVVDQNDKQLPDFDMYNLTARPLMPDLVVCLNPLENYTLLYESALKTIPTIGIIDTDADPTWVTYSIPANDDSLRSAAVVGGVLGRAGQRGQERRKHDTKMGHVPWRTSNILSEYMGKEKSAAIKKRKEVMGKMQQYQGLNDEETELMQQQHAGADGEMTEDAMLDIMGQAAAAAGPPPTAGSEVSLGAVEAQLDAVREKTQEMNIGAIEAQLDAVREKTQGVEKALKEDTQKS